MQELGSYGNWISEFVKAVLPERQPDSIEAKCLLAVHDGGEVTDLGEVPGVGIICIKPINHGCSNLKTKPVKTLQDQRRRSEQETL